MYEIPILIAICILSFVLKRPTFAAPLDRDYGAQGYVAFSMLKGRGLIYRDILESKMPGIYISYMLAIRLFGISRKTFRLFFSLYNTLTICVIFMIAQKLFSGTVGLVAAAFFAFYSSIPSMWWHFSNTEEYYILPSCVSIYLLLLCIEMHLSISFALATATGLFSGLTFMFKQTSLINNFLSIFIVFCCPAYFAFCRIAGFVIGFSVPLIIFMFYFVVFKKTPWNHIPFSAELLKRLVNYLKNPLCKYNALIANFQRQKLKVIFYDYSLIIILSVGAIIYLLWNHEFQPGFVLGLWLCLSGLSIIASRTYLPYHFIPSVPIMCILSAYSIIQIVQYIISNKDVLTLSDFITFSLMLILAGAMLYYLIKDLFLMSIELLGHFYSGEDSLFALCEEVGKYLNTVTDEDDYVYNWGSEQEIYLWSKRRCPSVSIFAPVMNPRLYDLKLRARELTSLQRNKPKYIAVTAGFENFNEFEGFISRNYVMEKQYPPMLYLFKLKTE